MQDTKIFTRLRYFNLIMGFFHLIQGILMILLSNDFKLTMTTSFWEWNKSLMMPETVTKDLLTYRVGPTIAVFLFLSAAAHFLLASPWLYDWYVRNLKRGINYLRWWEYFFSSSVMIVIIGMLSGITDFPSLILMFALNGVMNLFGLMMELHNQTTKETNWTSFLYGCIAGIVPWIVIFMYFFSAISSAGETVPTFVKFIVLILFVNFNIFAVNMILQYKKVGPWKNYLFGEAMYIVLSLVAKSLLAWQVFFGTLR
jgi:hypothetical protein